MGFYFYFTTMAWLPSILRFQRRSSIRLQDYQRIPRDDHRHTTEPSPSRLKAPIRLSKRKLYGIYSVIGILFVALGAALGVLAFQSDSPKPPPPNPAPNRFLDGNLKACNQRPQWSNRSEIPNIVHYVWVIQNKTGDPDFNLRFREYLSIYSASTYWNPETIYIHTNADGPTIERAISGESGSKWDPLIFNMPNVVVNSVEAPTHAGNGKKIESIEHVSDFIRVQVVNEFGGVYIDWDVIALRDIAPLRNSGFKGIGGRESADQLNSGTFMSKAGGKMIQLWVDGMHESFTGDWTRHSNVALTQIATRLTAEPMEMLILEQDAFAPLSSWYYEDAVVLYQPQESVKSNLKGLTQGDDLPAHEEDYGHYNGWKGLEEKEKNSWPRDFSNTYLLHAFKPWDDIEHFDGITPKYVLERRSNYARATYPLVRDMYTKGIVKIDED